MAPMHGKNDGGPKGVTNQTTTGKDDSASEANNPASRETGPEHEPPTAVGTSTPHRRSLSEESLHDAVEMPFLPAPPNTPTAGEQDEHELAYDEKPEKTTNTINQILDGYASHDETNADSPFRDPSCSPLKLRRNGTYQGFPTAQFHSPGIPPSDLPESPKSTSCGHQRSKHVLSFNHGSSPDSTVSDSQRLLNAESQASPLDPSEARRQLHDPDLYDVNPYDDLYMTTRDNAQSHSRHHPATLKPTRGREVSYSMRHVGKLNEGSQATLVSPGEESPLFARSQGSHLPTTSAYADLRGYRDDGTDENFGSNDQGESLPMRDSADTGTWCTTEMNSEAGFDRAPTGPHDFIKATGSSVAGFSEEGELRMPYGFGSRPRIIQHPGLDGSQDSYKMHYLKNSTRPMLLPKPQNARGGGFPQNSSRDLTGGGGNNLLTSPGSRNLSMVNPFVRTDSSRYNIEPGSLTIPSRHAGQSRYEFRDSVSTFATNTLERQPSNIRQSIEGGEQGNRSPVKGLREEQLSAGLQSTASNLSMGQSSSKVVEVSPHKPIDPRIIDHEHLTRRLGSRMIAPSENWLTLSDSTASNAQLPRSQSNASNAKLMTSRSQFEFDLIPLDEAQRKNKQQRESGETDETESTVERQQRSENAKSIRFVPRTPARMPHPSSGRSRRIEAAPQLSIDFSPSSVFYEDALRDITPPFSATTQPNLAHPQPARIRTQSATEDETTLSPSGERSWLGRMKSRVLSKKDSVKRKMSQLTAIRHADVDNDSQLSLAAIEDMNEPYLSHGARARRRRIFLLAASLSALFPFIAILVMAGVLSPVLLWYTSGEVRRLTIRQHNCIRNLFLAWLCAAMIVTPTLIAVFVKRS
ncbi:uncharacterized protein F4807DRAFT_467565 [Annulohypoxylon truncatum]|uniref:uncharacterized protein n=1 Tax=Annulohypoxylon truncatum TaxID=327061 RepID=UPI002007206E|nr:uncharacterized protein F4807DRAFT_467565 [Annulohypoxylon truncatum]KAI1209696.1 hypothetical protein F4807DRAFT_467565 [Annulohypoxylon truncatum]